MKFEYPITASYVSSWTVLHAMRELIANAMDAEAQLRTRKEIVYVATRRVARVINHGATLDRTALLLGGTTKDDRRLIGQYGEGLKLALLVLARAGLKVRVRNGRSESWTPSIAASEKWGADVLTLDVQPAKRQAEAFEVEVEGLDLEVWTEVEQLFLFMDPATTVDTPHGQVLVDAAHAGRIYVKGVYVTRAADYDHGYNFYDLDIGRDRQIPNSWDMEREIRRMHKCLLASDRAHGARLYDLLAAERPEVAAFRYDDDEGVLGALADRFVELHGAGVVPCAATSETADLEHLGLKGVAVPSRLLAEKLQRRLGGPEAARQARWSDPTQTWSVGDLTLAEGDCLEQALLLLERTGHVADARARTSVVDFRDAGLRGTHAGRDVRLARRLLGDFGATVLVLAHEFAHDHGGDGSFEHVAAMHRIAEAVLNLLYRGSLPCPENTNS